PSPLTNSIRSHLLRTPQQRCPPKRGRVTCEEWRGEDHWERARLETDADGRARFEHLAPDEYRLSPADGEGSQGVVVVEGSEQELVLLHRVEPSVRIHGVVTEGGRPLAGAKLEIGYIETATDAKGRYALTGLDAEVVDFTITHPRFGPVYAEGVSLVAPETRHDVALELTSLAGIVRDASDRPVGGVELSLGVPDSEGDVQVLWTAGRESRALHLTTSDAEGRFRIDGVQLRDDLWLVLERDEFLTQRIGPLVFPRDGSTLGLAPTLERAATLAVVVQGSDPQELAWIVKAVWLGEERLAPADREQRAANERNDGLAPGEQGFRFDRLRPGPWAIELHGLFEFERGPRAHAEITLPRTDTEPLILRP
ncbi:MAG: carboxypeptidase regulatory-like domain-containing protein, partial [Planctomycetes bacterium]|nr:carboxypeptidase regulatory-like domain-containing protein [Planctomycetota bacterium]